MPGNAPRVNFHSQLGGTENFIKANFWACARKFLGWLNGGAETALSVGEMGPWAGILDRIKSKLDVSICLSLLLEDTV